MNAVEQLRSIYFRDTAIVRYQKANMKGDSSSRSGTDRFSDLDYT